MFWGSDTPTENTSTNWVGITFATFGLATLVFALGYTFTRPGKDLWQGRSIDIPRIPSAELQDSASEASDTENDCFEFSVHR